MRDAESLLDQVLAYAGDRVTAAAVREAVGLADDESIGALLDAYLAGDAPAALEQIESLADGGRDMAQVAAQAEVEARRRLLASAADPPWRAGWRPSCAPWPRLPPSAPARVARGWPWSCWPSSRLRRWPWRWLLRSLVPRQLSGPRLRPVATPVEPPIAEPVVSRTEVPTGAGRGSGHAGARGRDGRATAGR